MRDGVTLQRIKCSEAARIEAELAVALADSSINVQVGHWSAEVGWLVKLNSSPVRFA